jgi:hypothetical protein
MHRLLLHQSPSGAKYCSIGSSSELILENQYLITGQFTLVLYGDPLDALVFGRYMGFSPFR